MSSRIKKGRQGQQPYCGHARQGKDSGSGKKRRRRDSSSSTKRKIEEYAAFIQCEISKKSKLDWVPPSLEGLTDANKQIAEWICSNIRRTRSFKAPQLFITVKPNLGKTSLVEWLKKFLSVYLMPTTEEFYDHYSDESTYTKHTAPTQWRGVRLPCAYNATTYRMPLTKSDNIK